MTFALGFMAGAVTVAVANIAVAAYLSVKAARLGRPRLPVRINWPELKDN